jgi:hypothetical protein
LRHLPPRQAPLWASTSPRVLFSPSGAGVPGGRPGLRSHHRVERHHDPRVGHRAGGRWSLIRAPPEPPEDADLLDLSALSTIRRISLGTVERSLAFTDAAQVPKGAGRDGMSREPCCVVIGRSSAQRTGPLKGPLKPPGCRTFSLIRGATRPFGLQRPSLAFSHGLTAKPRRRPELTVAWRLGR